MDAIRLSVLIACLNAQQTLGAQLEALATQDCPVPWELLICDNGSTDDTAAVVERYADRLPVRLIDAGARRGAAAARNVGARSARGEWLAFCDADDVVAEDWLATVCAALTEHRFVAGRFDGELLNSARARRSRPLDQQTGLQGGTDGTLPHAGAGNMGIHREVFLAVGGFDPSVPCLEDTDLCWRVQRTGVELVFVPEVVVHVRLRSTWRAMYRQGRDYGRAYADLQGRQATSPDVVPGRVDGAGGDGGHVPASPRTGPVARLSGLVTAWLGTPPSLARLVWQWGWHRGYHAAVAERRNRPAVEGPPRTGWS